MTSSFFETRHPTTVLGLRSCPWTAAFWCKLPSVWRRRACRSGRAHWSVSTPPRTRLRRRCRVHSPDSLKNINVKYKNIKLNKINFIFLCINQCRVSSATWLKKLAVKRNYVEISKFDRNKRLFFKLIFYCRVRSPDSLRNI